MILQTHHAAFDGISSLALLTAIGAAYRERAGTSRLPARRPLRRPHPARSGPPARPGPAARTGFSVALTRIAARLPGAATRIAARYRAGPTRPGYGCVQRSLPVPRPAREGTGPFPTVNDLLVAALIRTVDRWNTAHGWRSGRIRISVPVNDRGHGSRWAGPREPDPADPGHRAPPRACRPRTPARTRGGPDEGRQGAADSRTGRGEQAAGHRAGRLPPSSATAARLARRVAAPLCTDTALLSNLGAIACPPCFGGSGTEPLWFSGPARMPRGLGVGALTIAEQLHLCVHYRHALLDPGRRGGLHRAVLRGTRRAGRESSVTLHPGIVLADRGHDRLQPRLHRGEAGPWPAARPRGASPAAAGAHPVQRAGVAGRLPPDLRRPGAAAPGAVAGTADGGAAFAGLRGGGDDPVLAAAAARAAWPRRTRLHRGYRRRGRAAQPVQRSRTGRGSGHPRRRSRHRGGRGSRLRGGPGHLLASARRGRTGLPACAKAAAPG